MVRLSFLKKVYFKNQAEKLLKVFKKHKSVCSWLYKKKEFFFSIAEEIPLNLFFSNKGDHCSNIQLVEGNKLLQNDYYYNIADKLNTFVNNAVSHLNINENRFGPS